MRRLYLSWCLIAASAACAFTPSGGAGDGDAGPRVDAPGPDAAPLVGFRKPITIDPAQVDATLTDFPLWVSLADADLAAHADASGADIYFTDAGGTPLAHEVQAWAAGTGHLDAWVRVPTIAADTPTVVYLRYGDLPSAPAPNAAATWRDFLAVWHFDVDDPASEPDSATGRTATGSTLLWTDDVMAGRLGRGLRFQGDDSLTFANPYQGAGPHTMSAWIDQSDSNDTEAVVALGTSACGQARWFYTRYHQDTVATGFYCRDWDNPSVDVVSAGWTLLHWVYDGAGHGRLYRNGAPVAGPFDYDQPGTIVTAGTAGMIGNAPGGYGGAMGLHGMLDELRLASVPRTDAWIAAEYANQRPGATFYAVGPEE